MSLSLVPSQTFGLFTCKRKRSPLRLKADQTVDKVPQSLLSRTLLVSLPLAHDAAAVVGFTATFLRNLGAHQHSRIDLVAIDLVPKLLKSSDTMKNLVPLSREAGQLLCRHSNAKRAGIITPSALAWRRYTPRQQLRRSFHESRSLKVVKPYLLADIGEGWVVQSTLMEPHADASQVSQNVKSSNGSSSPEPASSNSILYAKSSQIRRLWRYACRSALRRGS
jgi:hypothetical protein